jgi:hypothetical protein
MHRKPIRALFALLVLALAALPAGCGDDETGAPATLLTPSQEFVGQLEGDDALVAVSLSGEAVSAFVCDSAAEGAAEYFGGERPGKLTSLSGSATLDVEVSDEAATGTVTLPGGEPSDFNATPTPGSGLYEVVQGARRTDGISAGDVKLSLREKGGELKGTATPPGEGSTVVPGGGQVAPPPPGGQPIALQGRLDADAPIGAYVAVVDIARGRICGAGPGEALKSGQDTTLRLSGRLGEKPAS